MRGMATKMGEIGGWDMDRDYRHTNPATKQRNANICMSGHPSPRPSRMDIGVEFSLSRLT